MSNCRVIHCPVGQVRNTKGECFYRSKLWRAERVGVSVKLVMPEPIKLPPNTSISDVHEFFKDIEFHIKSTLPWFIENTYFNFNAEANFVIIDFFAIEMNLQVDMFDPSELFKKINENLNIKWLVHFSNISESCSQELVPYQLSRLLNFSPQSHNGERGFMDEVYNLTPIKDVTRMFRYSFFISKTFFCDMLEFSDDEFQLLYDSLVVYIIEFDKYFGDMEFVLSVDSRRQTTVKVCMERLPFKRVVNDAANPIGKALTSCVLICGLVIAFYV
ncbi:hypothetical protein DPMN_054822 [Dreissena polymorpha]|uniref:Uncharacterized protein n=2 Tax=Dreissena polymorpha TaxID=45954 RepID=A0A9D4HRZ1_DREPO|nr:hypothetical protein DPMN_054822 [Dreissena polymorpha]